MGELQLSRKAFVSALEKGLGRAHLHLCQHGLTYADDLFAACLSNQSLDPQCEESKAAWLVALIDVTEHSEVFFERIIQNAGTVTSYYDALQYLQILSILTQRGYSQAKDAMYRTYDRILNTLGDAPGVEDLIEVDGLNAVAHIADIIGSLLAKDPSRWEDDTHLRTAYDALGQDAVDSSLQALSRSNRNIRKYLAAVEQNRRLRETVGQTNTLQKIDFENVLEAIFEGHYRFAYPYVAFGRQATPAQLETVYAHLDLKMSQAQILRCLWVFRHARIPLIDERLFALMENEDEEIKRAAIRCASQICDGQIKAYLLRKFQSAHLDALDYLPLWLMNYTPDILPQVESLIGLCHDKDDLHFIYERVIEQFKKQFRPELLTLLYRGYAETPCSDCRLTILQLLSENDVLTEDLIAECHFDALAEIRDLVRGT